MSPNRGDPGLPIAVQYLQRMKADGIQAFSQVRRQDGLANGQVAHRRIRDIPEQPGLRRFRPFEGASDQGDLADGEAKLLPDLGIGMTGRAEVARLFEIECCLFGPAQHGTDSHDPTIVKDRDGLPQA